MTDHSRRRLLGASGGLLLASGVARAAGAADRTATPTAASGSIAKCGAVPSQRQDGVLTGGARRIRIAGGHHVWVRQVGNGPIPVLTLHGGPGWNHFYLECLQDFLPAREMRFWYYDQLGCGFSDAPSDPKLWTLERYRDEVEEVRAALGLERFVLYGHSFGGMLAMEYALAYPRHLAGLVISNMTASVAAYVEHAAQLVASLPESARRIIAKYRASGELDAPEYQRVLMDELYRRHVCRLDPWPEPLDRAMRFANETIYRTMQGPDEFNITGNFKDWDVWARLPQIRVPTLLLAARHDEMSPEQMLRMSRLIPRARYALCPEGSHLAMYDDQRRYFAALVPFIREAYSSQA
ncbi:MAG: proline iminopeptidase-family hydrolase [Gammaproteobacteria bacterium]|nr:proline iminopeptidase-family hydrolase [Gammaproteobacteria bacterium]